MKNYLKSLKNTVLIEEFMVKFHEGSVNKILN